MFRLVKYNIYLSYSHLLSKIYVADILELEKILNPERFFDFIKYYIWRVFLCDTRLVKVTVAVL